MSRRLRLALLLPLLLVRPLRADPIPDAAFPGLLFDQPLEDRWATGEALPLKGHVADPAKADGRILFRFAPEDGGPAIDLLRPLRGTRFDGYQVFLHPQAGAYGLEAFVGGPADEQLAWAGGFAGLHVLSRSGPVYLPTDYFAGIRLDAPLPVELPVGRAWDLTGQVGPEVRAFRLELRRGADPVPRTIPVGVEDRRFRLPLRLRAEERGELWLRVVSERVAGGFELAGDFAFRGLDPPPAPRLSVGAVGLSLLPGGEEGLPLTNVGDRELAGLGYQVEGPFAADGPDRLAAGASRQVLVRYTGAGGDHGLLRVSSDDPVQTVQEVALEGLVARATAGDTRQARALREVSPGRLSIDLDLGKGDAVLVLYSAQVSGEDTAAAYAFSVGGHQTAARPALAGPQADGRDRLESEFRALELALGRRLRHSRPSAARSAATVHAVGERRRFLFPAAAGRAAQPFSAQVVALGQHAVAWLQDDGSVGSDALEPAQIQALLDRFDQTEYGLAVQALGEPSDVDGDGKLAFVFTRLVDELVYVGGLFPASSVLPMDQGGDGNAADLMFVSPTQPPSAYAPLLVHELQHLINFNQHVLVRRGAAEVAWLNEGLSHLAEDLVAGPGYLGQADNLAAYLRDPAAVGLEGDALLDRRRRGAAYLFLHSLADRLGPGLVRRLVNSSLADRDNLEAATGQSFEELLAYWGVEIYASGLGLLGHPRFNYAAPVLRSGQERGFPLPAALEYRAGGPAANGSLRPRGLSFVRVRGTGRSTVEVHADPDGQVRGIELALPRNDQPSVWVPAGYFPGVEFETRIPGAFVAGRDYRVAGRTTDVGVSQLLFRFAGPDTHRVYADVEDTRFAETVAFAPGQAGPYALELFAGRGDGRLDYVGRFDPVWVAPPGEPVTAVTAGSPVLPRALALGSAYPNPTNAGCVLPLSVPADAALLEVSIFDALGQRVRTLHRGALAAGQYRWHWDGADANGRPAASGVYHAVLSGGGVPIARPVVLLR